MKLNETNLNKIDNLCNTVLRKDARASPLALKQGIGQAKFRVAATLVIRAKGGL